MSGMKYIVVAALLLVGACVLAQNSTFPAALKPAEISGMYTFLREGEFVELDVDDGGQVSGFISRYGESDSDRGAFLDHMFVKAKLDGTRLTFATKPVHGVSFDFKGSIERGTPKNPGEEGAYVLKGTLTQITTGPDQKETAKSREVAFKSFPQDAQVSPARTKKD